MVQAPKKAPSKFFKSKSAPVVSNPAPLRPLEVTPNQPLKQSLPPAKPPAKGILLLGLLQMKELIVENCRTFFFVNWEFLSHFRQCQSVNIKNTANFQPIGKFFPTLCNSIFISANLQFSTM